MARLGFTQHRYCSQKMAFVPVFLLVGTGPGDSDADAIKARKQNALALDKAKLPLDIVVIANWTIHPSRNLPESDPNTLTYFCTGMRVNMVQTR